MRIVDTLLITCLMLVTLSVHGQRYSDHKWAKARPNIELDQARYGNEDAVLVYQYQTIQNNLANLYRGELQVRTTVMRRIKMLTKAGIEEHSIIHVNKRRSDKLEVLDARTIKADGKVIDMSAKDIRKLDLEVGRFGDDRYEQLRFAVPAAEPGDEIEMVYTLQSSGIRVGDDLYFHHELPVLRSVIILDMERIFETEVRPMNGAGDATVSKTDDRISYRWELKDLPGLKKERYGALSAEFPYISFVVRRIVITSQAGTTSYPVAPNSLANLFDQYVRVYGLEALADQSGYRLANKIRQATPGASRLELVQAAMRSITERLRIEDLSPEEAQQPLRYHLDAGRIDTYNLERLWWATLTALEVKPWVAFARNRYDGPLDASYISPHMVTATFFAFNDDDGRMHFVFPSSTTSSYALGELPWYLEGSNLLLARKDNFQNLVAETKQISVVRSDHEWNSTSEAISAELDLENGKLLSRHRMRFLGAMARKQQSELPEIIKDGRLAEELFDDEGVKLDSIDFQLTNDARAKSATLRFTSERTVRSEELEPGVRSIQLGKLFDVWTYGSFAPDRQTAIDLPYPVNDARTTRIVFSQPVELINAQAITGTARTSYGTCTLKVTQIDPRTAELRWSYTVTVPQVPVSGIVEFNRLHEHSELGRNSDLLVKLL